MADELPLILLDPYPRGINLIFDAPRRRMEILGEVVYREDSPTTDASMEEHLPETTALNRPAGAFRRTAGARAEASINLQARAQQPP